jgi:hypothetical protein
MISFAALEMLTDSQNDLISGSNISAARQDNVEADRKGQRGQQAEHGWSIIAANLKCAFLTC